VDHTIDFSKDEADTICMAVKILSGEKGTADIPVAAGGTVIGENLNSMGGQFV
jgi:hypothetical protein